MAYNSQGMGSPHETDKLKAIFFFLSFDQTKSGVTDAVLRAQIRLVLSGILRKQEKRAAVRAVYSVMDQSGI